MNGTRKIPYDVVKKAVNQILIEDKELLDLLAD